LLFDTIPVMPMQNAWSLAVLEHVLLMVLLGVGPGLFWSQVGMNCSASMA